MSTVSVSGHAKNAANLKKLIQVLDTFGTSYNPGNTALSVSALTALSAAMDGKIDAVNQAFNDWKATTNEREIAFGGLNKLSTQLFGALQSAGVAQQTMDDFRALVKKVRGETHGKITKADAGKTASDTGSQASAQNPQPEEGGLSRSTSQRSFDDILQHVSKMILLLQGETSYVPNESEMKVNHLQTKLSDLTVLHDNADSLSAKLKAARIERNSTFYKEGTGLLSVVKQVKAYVKSLYGGNSQQYEEVAHIHFYRVIAAKKAN